jgi:hypothetical protein
MGKNIKWKNVTKSTSGGLKYYKKHTQKTQKPFGLESLNKLTFSGE